MILSIARNRFLATVSTLTLITSACGSEVALAAEPDHEQTLWIELGWQADSVNYSKRDLDLPLGPLVPSSGLTAPLFQHLKTGRSNDIDSNISYKPEGSDWNFSASVRYGRSAQGKSQINQSKPVLPTTSFVSYHTSVQLSPYYLRHRTRSKTVQGGHPTLHAETANAESHFIVDFEAGKDVGLGLFGSSNTSTLNAGVRFAHFAFSREVSNFHESPGNVHFHTSHNTTLRYVYSSPHYVPHFHTKRRETWNDISANGSTSQNFSGIGPSLRWDASAQLWSDPRGGGISLDWGANAAILFGRQMKATHHQTTNAEHCTGYPCGNYPPAIANNRIKSSRNITVPNIGGFAGLSLRYTDVKLSLGYRADFFFNAIDGGVDTRKNENRGFYGPFASMSIGLGD